MSPNIDPGDMAAGCPDVLVTDDGPIRTVTLSRPDKLNALTPAMHGALQAAFDGFAQDPDLRVAILAGSGSAFCVGSDLKAAAARLPRSEGPAAAPRSGYGGLAGRFDLQKPLIAAVNGDAVGGGFELALACDLIVAAEGARFALPESHWGLVAIGGGPHRLARAIGMTRAKDIVLTGRWVDAREAVAMGFVNRVVAPQDLDEACRALAADLLRASPLALHAANQLLERTLDHPSLAAALGDQESLPAMKAWRASDEARAGARAFVARRRTSGADS